MTVLEFIDKIPSPYHTVIALREWLTDAGYTELSEGDEWKLVPEGSYFVTRGGSSLLAFRLPKDMPVSMMLGEAHSDFPTFRVKPKETVSRAGDCTGLSVEKYGGMLCAPWMDRPLSVAGRIVLKTQSGIQVRPVNVDRDLLVIPSVAIHMNREVNQSTSYNAATDMIPLFGMNGASLRSVLAEAAGAKEEDILSHDLFLYPRQKATLTGAKEEFLVAPHLDDISCVYALTKGFLTSKESAALPMLAVFDNEEVGSSTKQGANSTFLAHTLRRIAECYGMGETAVDRMLANGFAVSADNGHAIHPNHPEYADALHAPKLGGGVVVKFNASQKYMTDGVSAAIFEAFCQRANVPTQYYTNRADLPGGSTLGSICSTRVGLMGVDVGLAQLAMHSPIETAAIRDVEHLALAMKEVFSGSIAADGAGYSIQ